MDNWKTTLMGAGSILAGIGGIIKAIPTGDINTLAISITGIFSGIGLIFASDAKVK